MLALRKEYYGKTVAVVIKERSYTIDKDFYGRYSNAKDLIEDNAELMSKYFEIEAPEPIKQEKVKPVKITKAKAAK
jgi:hypothetical protein